MDEEAVGLVEIAAKDAVEATDSESILAMLDIVLEAASKAGVTCGDLFTAFVAKRQQDASGAVDTKIGHWASLVTVAVTDAKPTSEIEIFTLAFEVAAGSALAIGTPFDQAQARLSACFGELQKAAAAAAAETAPPSVVYRPGDL